MSNNHQYPPCFICSADVKRPHAPAAAKGGAEVMCSKSCAQAFFIGFQLVMLRAAIEKPAKLVLPA